MKQKKYEQIFILRSRFILPTLLIKLFKKSKKREMSFDIMEQQEFSLQVIH